MTNGVCYTRNKCVDFVVGFSQVRVMLMDKVVGLVQ